MPLFVYTCKIKVEIVIEGMRLMIDAKNVSISDSEWEVMRVIWTLKTVTSRQLINVMNETQGWSDSTTKTLLTRLVKKAAVNQVGASRPFKFEPAVAEKDSVAAAAVNLFDHMCAMQAGAAIKEVINSREISKTDIKNLQSLLADKLKNAPEMVACNCLPSSDSSCCEVIENEK